MAQNLIELCLTVIPDLIVKLLDVERLERRQILDPFDFALDLGVVVLER